MDNDTICKTGDIEAAIKAGKQALDKQPILHEDGSRHIVMPIDAMITQIPALNPKLPDDVGQSETLIEQQSFTEYVNRFKQQSTVIMANPARGTMKCVLNYHSESGGKAAKPSRCNHLAIFNCDYDENWNRWKQVDRRSITQEDFAYFVEEMLHTIGEPDGASLLDMAQNLKINRGVVFKNNKILKNGTVDIAYNEEDSATAGTGGSVTVPDEIVIVSPIFMLRDAQKVVAKLRYRVNKGEPLSFRIDILNRKLIEFEAFRKMADEVAKATNCPVYLAG